jgi:hypothetical protein
MKTFKFVPSICVGETTEWEGYVVLRPYKYDEKFDLLESVNIGVSEDGVDTSKVSNMQFVRKAVAASKDNYVEVKLKHKATGEEVTSFEEMTYLDEMAPVLSEVAFKLISGFKLGKD